MTHNSLKSTKTLNRAERREAARVTRLVRETLLAMGITPPDGPAFQPEIHEEPTATNPTPRKKFAELWASTPVWGIIGVLVGAIVSQISLNLIFALTWAVLCFEFVRLRIFESKLPRYAANLAFSIMLGAACIFVLDILPKPKEQPSLDQQLDAFAARFPFLLRGATPPNEGVLHTQPTTQNISTNQKSPSPRHTLNNKETQDFEKPLKAHKGDKQSVRIFCPTGDEQACIYAGQFINIFRDAGWVVEDGVVHRVTLGIPYDGIRLFAYAGKSSNPQDKDSNYTWMAISPSLLTVYKAFASIGIESDMGHDPDLSPQQMTVYFGPPRTDEHTSTPLTGTVKNIEMTQNKKSLNSKKLP